MLSLLLTYFNILFSQSLYANVDRVQWPKTATMAKVDVLPDGSRKVTSLDEYASLIVSPHGHDFSVCYLSKLSTDPSPQHHPFRDSSTTTQQFSHHGQISSPLKETHNVKGRGAGCSHSNKRMLEAAVIRPFGHEPDGLENDIDQPSFHADAISVKNCTNLHHNDGCGDKNTKILCYQQDSLHQNFGDVTSSQNSHKQLWQQENHQQQCHQKQHHHQQKPQDYYKHHQIHPHHKQQQQYIQMHCYSDRTAPSVQDGKQSSNLTPANKPLIHPITQSAMLESDVPQMNCQNVVDVAIAALTNSFSNSGPPSSCDKEGKNNSVMECDPWYSPLPHEISSISRSSTPDGLRMTIDSDTTLHHDTDVSLGMEPSNKCMHHPHQRHSSPTNFLIPLKPISDSNSGITNSNNNNINNNYSKDKEPRDDQFLVKLIEQKSSSFHNSGNCHNMLNLPTLSDSDKKGQAFVMPFERDIDNTTADSVLNSQNAVTSESVASLEAVEKEDLNATITNLCPFNDSAAEEHTTTNNTIQENMKVMTGDKRIGNPVTDHHTYDQIPSDQMAILKVKEKFTGLCNKGFNYSLKGNSNTKMISENDKVFLTHSNSNKCIVNSISYQQDHNHSIMERSKKLKSNDSPFPSHDHSHKHLQNKCDAALPTSARDDCTGSKLHFSNSNQSVSANVDSLDSGYKSLSKVAYAWTTTHASINSCPREWTHPLMLALKGSTAVTSAGDKGKGWCCSHL